MWQMLLLLITDVRKSIGAQTLIGNNMNRRKEFFKSGITLTAVGLSLRTVGMLFGAFVTRTIGAEGVGLYTVIMTVYAFAITFATSGISLTVTRLVAGAVGEGRGYEIGKILRAAVLYSLAFSAFSTLLLFIFADVLSVILLSELRAAVSLRILALSLIPVSLCSVFSGYFVGVKRVRFNATAQVISQLFKIAVTVVLVLKLSEGGALSCVMALCIGTTVTELCTLLLVFFEYVFDRRKHGENKITEKGGRGKDVLGAALPLAVSAYFRSVLTTAEHILIPKRLMSRGEGSSEAYAHYGVLHGMALPVVLYPMAPLSSFSGLLVPEFAEDSAGGNKKRMERVASEALNTTLTYAALASVFLFCFSEELGYAIYGSYDAGKYIAVLAFIVPIMYLDHVTDGILKGIGEQVYSMWVNITDALLSLVLVYFLIPPLGIFGYAVVIVVMEGYNFLASAARLGKRIKIRLDIISSALIPAAAAVFAAELTNFLMPGIQGKGFAFWLVLKMVLALAAFVFVMMTVRACAMGKDKRTRRKRTQ